jgi:hypothetical protein
MIWLNLAVKPHFSWPITQVELPFEGKKIVLQPLTEKLACTASFFEPNGTTFEDGGTLLGRFLSRLAWSKNAGIEELFYIGSNNPQQPGRLGRGSFGISAWAPVEPWDYLYLPAAHDPRADLALALFREGMSVNSAPFAFLSFFKIVNILHAKGDAQKNWINDNVKHLWYPPAVDRMKEIARTHRNIGEYMYVQGRCAVAHAYGTPLVNPDIYSDKYRLELDLPLIKDIAALCIEREFGIRSDSTFYKDTDGASACPELLRKIVMQGESDRVKYVEYTGCF